MNHFDPSQKNQPGQQVDLNEEALRRLMVVTILIVIGILIVTITAFYFGMAVANAVGMAWQFLPA